MSRFYHGRIKLKLAIAGLSLLLTLVGLEIGLRLNVADKRGFKPSESVQESRDLIVENVPGKSFVSSGREYAVAVTYNSLGMRDKEYATDKSRGVRRIAIMGDSFVEALQVKTEETFVKLLEQKLNQLNDGWQYEVMNFGVSGYGPDQEWLWWRKTARQFKPDLTIVMLSHNDLTDIKLNQLVSLTAGGLRWQQSNEPAAFKLLVKQALRQVFTIHWLGQKLQRLPGIKVQLIKLRNWIFSDQSLIAERELSQLDRRLKDIPLEVQLFIEPSYTQEEKYWDLTQTLIKTWAAEIEASGSELLLTVSTADPQFYALRRREFLGVYAPEDLYRTEALDERVKTLAQDLQVGWVGLYPALAEAAERGDKIHFTYDGHWTPRGHQIVAKTLFNAVVELSNGSADVVDL